MEKKKAYVVCPLCARNRPIETERKGNVRWDFWNEDSLIIQVRSAPGGKIKGSDKIGKGMRGKAPSIGFPLIKEESLTLDQILENEDYKELINNIKNQLLKVNKIFINKKILKKSDFKL